MPAWSTWLGGPGWVLQRFLFILTGMVPVEEMSKWCLSHTVIQLENALVSLSLGSPEFPSYLSC